MEIRTFSLDCGLTVAEIDTATEGPWHFLPFEDSQAALFRLDDRYVVAFGGYGDLARQVSIFDCAQRRRSNYERNYRLLSGRFDDGSRWCYVPQHGAVFILEGYNSLRQVSVDGIVNRPILIAPDFHAHRIEARDDGLITCVGVNRVAVLDPATGTSRVSETDLIAMSIYHPRYNYLQWFSPDGHWALRPHLGSIVRWGDDPAEMRSIWQKAGALLRRRGANDAAYVDGNGKFEPSNDGVVRFGIALDLFRLDPICLQDRLIVGCYTIDELFPDTLPEFRGRVAEPLHELARLQDHRTWDGRTQLLLQPFKKGDKYHQYDTPENNTAKILIDQVRDVRWDRDSCGFEVALIKNSRRLLPSSGRSEAATILWQSVLLDGSIGDTRVADDIAPATPSIPSQTAISAIQSYIRSRSVHS